MKLIRSRARAKLAAYSLTIAVMAAGFVGITGGSAGAHSALQKTNPAADSTVATLPARIELVFNEPALAPGTIIQVTNPAGQIISAGEPELTGNAVRQGVDTAGAAPGKYRVVWRVTSKDGHPISGTFTFTTKGSGATAPSSSAPTSATSGTRGTSTAAPTAGSASPPASGGSPSTGDAAEAAPRSNDGWEGGALVALLATVVVVFGGAAALLALRGRRDS